MRSAGRRARSLSFLPFALLLVPGAALAMESAESEARARRPAQTFELRDPREASFFAKAAPALPSERMGLDLAATPGVILPGIEVETLLRQDEEAAQGGLKALRIGLGRDLEAGAGDGHWYDLGGGPEGGRLWALEVGSAGALGLRVHFRDVRLPEGAELAVYSPADLLPRDQRKADATDGTGRVEVYRAGGQDQFWTATLAGERVRIEYYAPPGSTGAEEELPFVVDRLQHVYRDPVAGVVAGLKGKVAGPCHNDVSCFPEWGATANAVGGIGFIGSDFLFCSGQLLNSEKQDLTPFWLTANHCVSTQETAGASEIFWFYQTATCGGTPPALTSLPRSVGTTLLANNGASDFALLLVEGAVPFGLTWAGWNSAPVGDGTPATAIHHPSGDFKRISFGSKGQSDACASNNLVRINWSDAPTEPGSSGSGIFNSATHQLFGQLFFGPSACGNETYDCYGAFASTYPNVRMPLRNGGSDDNSEQNDTCKKAKRIKTGRHGGRVVKAFDTDWYRISVPKGKTLTVTSEFHHPSGDVDAKLYTKCGAEAVVSSTGTGNSEVLTVTNAGKKPVNVFWNVYLASDVRALYDLTVSIQ